MSSRAQVNPFFTPTQISGCTLWLDPTDLTTFTFNGTGLTQWRDKSTTGAIFTGSGTPPTLSATTYNRNKPVSFSGSSYFQNTTFTYTTSSRSAFFVFDETTEQSYVGVLSFASLGTDWNQLNTMVYETGLKPTQYLQIAQSHTNGGYYMSIQSSTIGFALYSDTFGSGRETAYVNGSQTGTTTSVAGFTNSTGLVIGARMVSGSISNYLIGVIGEIILYNRPLSTAERQQVEGYLAWKWGLQSSLPANHPYKNSPIPPLLNPPTTLPSLIQNPSVNLWVPSEISGLNLWLDAQDPNANGIPPANLANLTAWNDKSPSRFRLTSSGSAYSTTAVNRLPGINIGTNFFGFDPGSPQNNWQEVFAVGLWTGGSTFNTFNGFVTSSVDSDGGSSGGIILIGNSGTTAWHPTSYDIPWLNGTQTNTFLPTGAQPFVIRRNSSSSVNLRGIRFGVDRSNGRPWVGFISEVLSYNTALTLAQRQQIEGYLAWKWGLISLLPSTHPYKTIVPSLAPVSVSGVSRASINSWNPLQISGLQLWLDAADASTLTVAGSAVTQWRDKSGNSRNATGSLSPTLVQGIQNKLPAIYFNGASYMTGSLTNTTNQQSFFSVFRYNTGAPQYARLASFGVNGQFDYNNNAYYNISYNTGTLAITRSPTETQVTLAAPALDAFHQASVIFTGTNGLYYTDGGAYSNTAAWTANFNFTQYRLGTDQIVFVPQQMIGYIAEVIVYSGGVTTQQRQQVEGYLAWKWGLQKSLPAGHPWANWPPPP